MGQIIGLDGLPLKSPQEEKQEADAKEVVGKAINKLSEFKTPQSVDKAMKLLNKNGYGYCILLIDKNKTATQVHHNIKHDKAEMLIQQSIHNHFAKPTEQ